jgi:hypothetical protein
MREANESISEADCVSTLVREEVVHDEPISPPDQEALRYQTVHNAHEFRPRLPWVLAKRIAKGHSIRIIEPSQDFIQGFIP